MASPNPTIDGRKASDVLAELTAPVPHDQLEHRQDGKAIKKDDQWRARFVTYISAGFVRQRLDQVVPFRWELTFSDGKTLTDEDGAEVITIKATLAITLDDGTRLEREDFGEGRSYKGAATDAFKRAAVRWGIGGELHMLPQLWVQVDSDSRYAKPLEDPSAALAKALKARERKAQRAAAQPNDAPSAPTPARRVIPRGAPKRGEPGVGTALITVYQQMSAEQREAVLTLRSLMADATFSDHQRQQIDEWLVTNPSAADIRARTVKATEHRDAQRTTAQAS